MLAPDGARHAVERLELHLLAHAVADDHRGGAKGVAVVAHRDPGALAGLRTRCTAPLERGTDGRAGAHGSSHRFEVSLTNATGAAASAAYRDSRRGLRCQCDPGQRTDESATDETGTAMLASATGTVTPDDL